MKKILIPIIFITLSLLLIINWNQKYESTTAQIKVIDKKVVDPESYSIVGVGTDNIKIEIIIKNEDVWDLLEVNRTYTLVIERTNNELPILTDVIVSKNE